MDSQANDSAEKALFDETAFMASMGGDKDDAITLLDAATAEMHLALERMRQDIEASDFEGIQNEASTLREYAIIIASKTIELAAGRAFRMALICNADDASMSCWDIADCVKMLELQLRRSGWRSL